MDIITAERDLKNDEIFHTENEKHNSYTNEANGDQQMFWLKDNFFLNDKRLLFGTWNGVFTSIILSLFSIIMYMRAGWMVANAGIIGSLVVIFASFFIAIITLSSAIALCEKCKLNHETNVRGGVYFLLSDVLGIKFATCIGLFYCFGQAVGTSLTLTAFGESISILLEMDSQIAGFVSRMIAIVTLILILFINLAGVKWVIRFQVVLVIVLLLSVVDFVIGSFVKIDPYSGIINYDWENFLNNLYSNYSSGESLFTIYGVFFPATTGIFAGINMAYELKNPGLSIPVGTYGGIFLCSIIYGGFIIIYGSVVIRSVLYNDILIGAKVSHFSFLFWLGFYMCSVSSTIGSFYAPARLIQSIARQDLLPKFLFPLKNEYGENKLPITAILLVSLVSFLFIFVGEINVLASITTMPYMMTYAAINFAYFACKLTEDSIAPVKELELELYKKQMQKQESIQQQHRQLGESDVLMPDLVMSVNGQKRKSYQTIGDSSLSRSHDNDIYREHGDFNFKFSNLSNKWISIFGALMSLVSMVVINYIYAIVSFVICFLLYLQLRMLKPGLPKGSSNLKIEKRLKAVFIKIVGSKNDKSCLGRVYESLFTNKKEPDFMVVTPPMSQFETKKSQLNQHNFDYSSRKPYHHYEKRLSLN